MSSLLGIFLRSLWRVNQRSEYYRWIWWRWSDDLFKEISNIQLTQMMNSSGDFQSCWQISQSKSFLVYINFQPQLKLYYIRQYLKSFLDKTVIRKNRAVIRSYCAIKYLQLRDCGVIRFWFIIWHFSPSIYSGCSRWESAQSFSMRTSQTSHRRAGE